MKKMICLVMGLLLLFGEVTVNFSYADTAEIEGYIKTLEIGSPFSYRNLTIVPIYAGSVRDKTDYLTLDEAVTKGYITIAEVDGGRVPQVRVNNNSNHYILLVAGEILTGGRQDRLVGRDALIGPRSKNVILPVYCSEQGRWTYKSQYEPYFLSEKSQAEPYLRRQIYAKESQSSIWNGISGYHQKVAVSSKTSALQDAYRDKQVQSCMQEYVDKLEIFPRLEEDAIGVVVGLGDKIIGIDIFANPRLFVALWPKLLKSYVSLAIAERDQKGSLTQRQVKDILNTIYRVNFSRQPGLDLGEELQADTSGMVCSALAFQGNIIHLGVFPTDEEAVIQRKDNSRIRAID